MEKTPKIL